MSENYITSDDESSESTTSTEQNTAVPPPNDGGEERPIDPPPPGDPLVSLDQVSPLAGAMAGGISITLTGSGFQPGAAVYFGNTPATQVTVESGEIIRAISPPSSGSGSVTVSVINPDGSSAAMPGGFTYVTPADGQQAEVIGVNPLAVIEDTTTVVTIRGRNLIAAYNEGLLALRGPSRCNITFLGTSTSHDTASGIDTVNMTVNVQCTPALDPLERMAVQVLASRRAEAANDGVVESSRQMFTVLPKAVPVILAYTANLNAGMPNLVMVSGRNLDGHSLSLDDGAEVAFQTNDGNFLSGIVTLPENVDTLAPLNLSMLDSSGTKVAEYRMEVTPDSGYVSLDSEQNFASPAPGADELAVNLTAAPNQQFTGPTANDSAAFSVQSGNSFGFGFDFANFAFTILDITIILPIINEVYMLPHFDGGDGDDLNSQVLAEVGGIFRLRGAGLLVAIQVEVEIRIQVVLIIGFYYRIWDYGFYNEFPEFGWSIGSVVIGIQVHISVVFHLAALVALVKPDGQLKLLASFSITFGFDFFFDSNGTLRFRSGFRYRPYLIGITPRTSDPLLCEGKFELLRQNGQAAVADEYGFVAQYVVHDTGICCLPWDFDVRLLRYDLEGREEVVQEGFQTSHCVTAVERPQTAVTLSLAYEDDSTKTVIPVTDIYRDEPDSPKERKYFLAANFTLPPNSPKQLKAQIKLDTTKLFVNQVEITSQTSGAELPFPDKTFGTKFDKTAAKSLEQFFDINGKLIVPQTIFEATYDQDVDGTNWVAFANAELIPNREENAGKFVPPGPNVTAHLLTDPDASKSCDTTERDYTNINCKRYFEVRMKFTDLKVTNLANNNTLSFTQKTKNLNPKIVNQETFEEYFRVFREVRNLMNDHSDRGVPGSIGNFTKELIAGFPPAWKREISTATLQTKGMELWNKGRDFIKSGYATGKADDRILYFSRLEALAALRDIQNRRLTALSKAKLDAFEYYSRGFEKDLITGNFIVNFGTATNNVLVTGFDPFELYYEGLISNTAGLIALGLPPSVEVISTSNSKVTYNIKTAVFPVRFRDFGNIPDVSGVVEGVMKRAVKDCVMIMTCSWTYQQEFRIDRFGAKFRALDATDNENIKNKKENPVGMGPFYLESTLPYDGTGVVDIGANKNREITGPFTPTYLILDQSFELKTQGTVVGTKICNNQVDPTLTNPDSYQRVFNTPLGCGPLINGSGGNYLSNEIFYRTSRVRWLNRGLLPTGHLHVPSIGTDPYTGKSGAKIIDGGRETLESLLKYVSASPSVIKLEFPDTKINSSGTNLSYSLSLQAHYPFDKVEVSSVEITPSGSPFQLTTATPITVNRGQSTAINIKFTPTEVKQYVATANFKAADGSILYTAELKGKGIASHRISGPNSITFPQTITNTGTPLPKINYASASTGSVATASSADPNYPASLAVNGDRTGSNLGVWISGFGLPQWLEIDFGQSRTINEVNVVTAQDNYQNPVEPTLDTVFTSTHAVTAFDVQYWDGSTWVNIASVTGNNKVWRHFTFSSVTTTKIRVNVTGSAGDNYAYLTEVEALGDNMTPPSPPSRVNYALASTGSVATASSADPNYPASSVINGDRAGSNLTAWISGVGFPQWLEVDFGQSRTINEINVVTVQDDYLNPIEPTLDTVFTSTHANTAFDIHYWNGSTWVNITAVTSNNKVWRQFTFSPVTTTKIRVNVTGSGDNYAYLTEVEALGNDSPLQQSTTSTLTVTNDSDESIAIGSIELAAPFSVTLSAGSGSLPILINAGTSLTLSVNFTPTTTGVQTGVLTLRDTNGAPLLSIELNGEGVQS